MNFHFLSFKSQSGVDWDVNVNKLQQFDPKIKKKKANW